MKRSELKQLIREEVKRNLMSEGILGDLISSVFGKIAAKRGDEIRKQLQKDPEIIKLQKGIQDDWDEMQEIIKKYRDQGVY